MLSDEFFPLVLALLFTFSMATVCPVMTLISSLKPWQGFRLIRKRRRSRPYITLHLSGLDRVGHLNRRRAARLHQNFLSTLKSALLQGDATVYFTSHLMRPAHMKSMTTLLASLPSSHQWRCQTLSVSRAVRTGIRLQILVQEWRWIKVSEKGVLVVIRPGRNS